MNLRSVIFYAISNQDLCPITDYSRLKYLSIDKRGDGVRAKISLSQVQNCKKNRQLKEENWRGRGEKLLIFNVWVHVVINRFDRQIRNEVQRVFFE